MKASQLGGGSNVYLDLFLHVTQSEWYLQYTLEIHKETKKDPGYPRQSCAKQL